MTDRGSDVEYSSAAQDRKRRESKERKRRRGGKSPAGGTIIAHEESLAAHLAHIAAEAHRNQVVAGLSEQADLAMMHYQIESCSKNSLASQVIKTAMVEFALVVPDKSKKESRTTLAINYALQDLTEEQRRSDIVREAIKAIRNSLQWAYAFLKESGLR